jgi:formate-dependent nitrite reductase membrane component NrfD
MIDAPSSTWFTISPHWGWYIVAYFFLGGLAGGCYFLASLIDLAGRPEDRRLARLGYYIAFPLVLICGLLLTIDLGRPERFWHMLIQRNTFAPMFKAWSPMSFGSWAVLLFGIFSFLSFLAALAEEDRPLYRGIDRLRFVGFRQLRPPAPLGTALAVIGGIAGYFLAGYTGILLAVTNRPIWSDTPLLGLLFIVSAASTSAALLILLAYRRGWTMPGLVNLHRMDEWVLAIEVIVIIAVIVSLGPVARAWLNVWGLLLALTVIGGMIVPLVMSWRARAVPLSNVTTSAALVLVGGLLLRIVIIFSSETI